MEVEELWMKISISVASGTVHIRQSIGALSVPVGVPGLTAPFPIVWDQANVTNAITHGVTITEAFSEFSNRLHVDVSFNLSLLR